MIPTRGFSLDIGISGNMKIKDFSISSETYIQELSRLIQNLKNHRCIEKMMILTVGFSLNIEILGNMRNQRIWHVIENLG